MKTTDWIAIIGALAWTPYLFTALKQWLTKPVVRVLTNRFPEVGFTTLGPIFNLRLAFSVKSKDVVISDIRIKIRHEGGDERTFVWQGIVQQVGRMTMPDSNVMPFDKEQSVLAIKLNEKDIEERFIRFQEASFITKRQDHINKASKRMAYLKAEGKYLPEDFSRDQEMAELYGFTKHSFAWKPGRYFVRIEMSSPEKFEIVDQDREFLLTPLDVERLSQNLVLIEEEYRRVLIGINDADPSIVWQWSNPELIKT